MTGEEARHRTVAAEVNLCNECLAEAAFALQGGFYRLVRSRAYYACFHAATAVFAARGETFRRHSGLLAALRSDYGDVSPVTAADAERAIADARRIVAWLLPLTDPVT
ncbi:MAG: HEPN domain-containing protein [Planctomycetia bacterium]